MSHLNLSQTVHQNLIQPWPVKKLLKTYTSSNQAVICYEAKIQHKNYDGGFLRGGFMSKLIWIWVWHQSLQLLWTEMHHINVDRKILIILWWLCKWMQYQAVWVICDLMINSHDRFMTNSWVKNKPIIVKKRWSCEMT
jgi:hypothetical protein